MIPSPIPIPLQPAPPSPGPGGAPSTGPRPASSTPRTHGSLRHAAGTGELRRQRPVLSLSSSVRSMPPQRQPTAGENSTSGADPSARFPRTLTPLLMLANRRVGPAPAAPAAPAGVVVYTQHAVVASVLSAGNCSLRGLPPRAWFEIEGGQGHLASSAPWPLEPGPQ